jgi:HAD domain in Swiss Army Knife RNA repair proteins
MILFLDFDGVLHPDPCTDRARLFERAPPLAAALAPFASLSIVLSTSWRTHDGLDGLVARLPAALGARVIGVTPLFQDIRCEPRWTPYRRQAECLHWLARNGRDDGEWIALDDRPSGFEPYCERLLLCRSDTGLDDAVLNRMRFALMRGMQRELTRAAA